MAGATYRQLHVAAGLQEDADMKTLNSAIDNFAAAVWANNEGDMDLQTDRAGEALAALLASKYARIRIQKVLNEKGDEVPGCEKVKK